MRKISNRYYNHLEFHPQPNLLFNSSENFIEKVKNQFHYSTRMCHVKRRSAATHEEISNFIKRTRYVITQSKNKKQVLYVDESFCRTNQIFNFKCAHKGDDDIHINTSQGDKAGFTFVGTIGLDGSRHPLQLITSGKTYLCEHNWFGHGYSYNDKCNKELLRNTYCDINEHIENDHFYAKYFTVHACKGWTNIDSWKVYLEYIRFKVLPPNNPNFYDKENKIYLIADCYGSHHCDEIDDFTTNLNIDIILIPRCLTHIYQPLDFIIFGLVKARKNLL